MSIAVTSSKDFVTYKEAAMIIDRGLSAIDRAVAWGHLTTHKFPGDPHRYIRRADVEAWKGRRGITVPPTATSEPPPAPASAPPAPASAPPLIAADAFATLASQAIAGHQRQTREGYIDMIAASAAGTIDILESVSGGQRQADMRAIAAHMRDMRAMLAPQLDELLKQAAVTAQHAMQDGQVHADDVQHTFDIARQQAARFPNGAARSAILTAIDAVVTATLDDLIAGGRLIVPASTP